MKRDVSNLMPAEAVSAAAAAFPNVVTIGMKCTETGNAERLVARYRNQIRYCPPLRRWLVWDDRRWSWDDRGLVKQFAKRTVRAIYAEADQTDDDDVRKAIVKHARDSEKGAARKQMVELAQSEEGIPILPTELDADPWALNCANGTIDLRTGTLRPHNRLDLITKLAPVTYDKDAKSELWTRYLADATGGDQELTGYLQRAVGYALQGNVTEKCFWFIYGEPDGMKSTFIDAVSSALGSYAKATDFQTWLVQTHVGGNRSDLVSLLGARLVCSVEVRKGARFDEALMKKVTGGDEMQAADKFEKSITWRPTFALWLAGNDSPVIRDDDEGAWSRVRRVPFNNPLPADKRDVTMRERLRAPEVQSAILAWAVAGCLAWQADGLGTCAAVEHSSAEYRSDMDRVAGFFSECCKFEAGARLERKALRDAYDAWCRENAVKAPLSAKELAKRMREKGVVDGKSDGSRVWKGVRLLAGDEMPDVATSDAGTQGQERGSFSQSSPEGKMDLKLSVETDPPCPCGPDEASAGTSVGPPVPPAKVVPEQQAAWEWRS